MRPSAIVFDFDLTLADAVPAFVACHVFASEKLGLPRPTQEIVTAIIGIPLPISIRTVQPSLTLDDELAAEYLRLYQAHADEIMVELTHFYPGVIDALRSMHHAGIKLGIVSQKLRYRIDPVLERDGVHLLFDAVLGAEDVPAFKPDPRGVQLVFERLEAGDEGYFCGDTVVDGETARNVGCPFVAVLSGVTSADAFAPYEPLVILNSVADLPGYLGIVSEAIAPAE